MCKHPSTFVCRPPRALSQCTHLVHLRVAGRLSSPDIIPAHTVHACGRHTHAHRYQFFRRAGMTLTELTLLPLCFTAGGRQSANSILAPQKNDTTGDGLRACNTQREHGSTQEASQEGERVPKTTSARGAACQWTASSSSTTASYIYTRIHESGHPNDRCRRTTGTRISAVFQTCKKAREQTDYTCKQHQKNG